MESLPSGIQRRYKTFCTASERIIGCPIGVAFHLDFLKDGANCPIDGSANSFLNIDFKTFWEDTEIKSLINSTIYGILLF